MNTYNRRRFLGGAAALAGAAAVPSTFADDAEKETSSDKSDASTAKESDKPARTPHTKFAANLEMWWGKLPFADRVQAAADLGFPAVEFWPWRNKDIDALAAQTADLGLAVAQFTAWGFTPGMNETKNHAAFVAEVKASCEVAHKLRCKMMCVVGGNDVPGLTQAAMHANIIAALKLAAPVVEDAGVMLILEPMNIRVDHKGHCLYGSVDAANICRAVDSPMVKINWDLYHMQISEGDLCGRLRDGFDQLGYLQLADHPGRCEPGTGEIHYPRVLQAAQALGYRGYVGVECRPQTTELAAAQALARADDW